MMKFFGNERIQMVADNSSIGHIMGMDEKKAEMLEAYIKNQYVRTIVKVIKFKKIYKMVK